MSNIRCGENIWVRYDAVGKPVTFEKSASRPEGEDWFPYFSPNRVTGDSYRPYQGTSEWVGSANQAMREEANANFRRRN